jgi:hypothetical protein
VLKAVLPLPQIILTAPQAGVNIRHLGYLRRRVNEKHQRDILIEVRHFSYNPLSPLRLAHCSCTREMIARVVRKEVEKLLREKTRSTALPYLMRSISFSDQLMEVAFPFLGAIRSSGIPSEEPHRVAVVGYLNKLLGRDSKSKAFWRHMKRTLQDKFAVRPHTHKLSLPTLRSWLVYAVGSASHYSSRDVCWTLRWLGTTTCGGALTSINSSSGCSQFLALPSPSRPDR